ncbi:MAG: hypothetical protein EBR55_02145 [Chitinophagia bacterium]|nr:hypothetical protein [Chitinophagia bacterium]
MVIIFNGKNKLVIFLIPKIIWQTYETEYELLPENIKSFRESWIKDYPEFEHRYVNSEQRKEFVLKEFGKNWHEIFINVPNNITRANLWMYMNLYVNGGIYMDLDCLPLQNINEWLIDEYDFIVWQDTSQELLFSIALVASAPKNPILKCVLDNIINNINNKVYDSFEKNTMSYVFQFAEVAFANGIKKALGVNKELTYQEYNSLPLAKKYKFHCYPEDFYNENPILKHTDGANNWKTGYTSWWKEVGYDKVWNRGL